MNDTKRNNSAESRVDRVLEAREHQERPKVWQPASTLPEPIKEAGYNYRWIRVSSMGKSDAANVSGKMREGWEPVRAEEQPQLSMLADADSKFTDNIEMGGLLLCKMATEMVGQRAQYFKDKNKANMESVDNNFMRDSDPRMPLFKERNTKTSFGRGN
jgi:hypothetical protein